MPYLAPTLLLPQAAYGDEYEIHGSGTTNPSKCIWHIMSLFNQQTRENVRMTYRAVGSSTGQKEFIGEDDSYLPLTDFGAGDIPIDTDKHKAVNAAQPDGIQQILHLPFALSSVSFFFNIPGVSEVNLEACTLARIFNGKIQYWDDPEILELNKDNGYKTPSEKYNIFVARRVLGSSSTASITKYLNLKCEDEWPASMVGKELTNWHESTNGCEGSAGMTTCIVENNGGIGYMESGHGWSEGLTEIKLQNKDGTFLTSRHAFETGGVADAAATAVTRSDAFVSWGGVHFIDQAGPNTWPIVVMSYIYVRNEIHRYVPDNLNRGLLKRFLESLYKEKYFGQCQQLGFIGVPEGLKTLATDGIKAMQWEFDNNAADTVWQFEEKTTPYIGAGQYQISVKRRNFQGEELQDVSDEFASLRNFDEDILQYIHDQFNLAQNSTGDNAHRIFTQRHVGQIDAALVLSALSFSLWAATIIGFIVYKCICRN